MRLLSFTVICSVPPLSPHSLGPARVGRLALEIANGGSLVLPPLTSLTCMYLCVTKDTLAR